MNLDTSPVLAEGPWRHIFVPANGARFHVALAGRQRGDLVLLLHGFPQHWWAWRHQLVALAEAGYRVAAMDLRGAGASDKPPLGYDLPTLTRDVAGVVRSLGSGNAVVVGHGIGGLVAWSMPHLRPAETGAVVAVSAPHPLQLRGIAVRVAAPQAIRRLLGAQLPWLAERGLTRGDVAVRVLREWGAPGWLSEEDAARYRAAIRMPFAAYGAVEPLRWLLRSSLRMDGQRYRAAMRMNSPVPALQLHGGADRGVPLRAIHAPAGNSARVVVPGAGHFLPEEAPEAVTQTLLTWLAEVAPAA